MAYVYPVLWFFGGVLALWLARHVSTEVRSARDWPTVPGKILERGLGEPSGIGAGRTYLPHVKYSYSVAGKDYVNDQVYLIRSGGLADTMRRLVDRLPDPVPVHYDPQDPARSYLLVNRMWWVWLLVGFGVLALVLGLVQLVVA